VRFFDIIKAIEHWASRARTWLFIFGFIIAVPTIITLAAGYLGGNFGQTPFSQLIPAVLLTIAASAWLGRGALNRALMFSSGKIVEQDQTTEERYFSNFFIMRVQVPNSREVVVIFTPTKHIDRLQVCVDQSSQPTGAPYWSATRRLVVADLRDLIPGVQINVPLTEMGKRGAVELPETGWVEQPGEHPYMRWANSQTPISSYGRYRGRVALLMPDRAETYRRFFAITMRGSDGAAVFAVIDEMDLIPD
jgi:hypothetical protein